MAEPGEARTAAPAGCGDHDPEAIGCEEALARLLDGCAPVAGTERVALRSGLGRVLAADIRSHTDVPPHTNSAMDGYAVRSADLEVPAPRLELVGEAFAGRPFGGRVGPGQCVRIMTGAVVPEGADTVVPQEYAERHGEAVHIVRTVGPGENVRAAGEDLAAGEVVLESGHRLTPADLGLLASLGFAEVPVRRRLRAAFFSTGDELRSIGEPLGPGDIYDSNRYTLYGMLTALGADLLDLGVVRDVPEELRRAFLEAAACADVVLTSGGVSVGEADYVKRILEEVGQIRFWKVAMKPGRPLAVGRIGDAAFFSLPGNPVSAMVTFYQFVQPTLRRMMGEREVLPLTVRARCTARLRKKPGRAEFQRGVLERAPDGVLTVRTTGAQGSGILRSMSEANCFIVLPLEQGPVEPGAEVDVQPFRGLVW